MRPQAQDISNLKPPVTVIEWVGDAKGGHLRLLDQTKLPARTAFVDCNDIQAVFEAIRRLVVRGAPAIGIAAGYGMVLAAQSLEGVDDKGDCSAGLKAAAEYLIGSRPTAVNLEWPRRFAPDGGESGMGRPAGRAVWAAGDRAGGLQEQHRGPLRADAGGGPCHRRRG